MRSKLLIISAAALLAGTVMAMGQGGTERKDQPGVSQGQPGQAHPKGARGAQKEQPSRPATTAQTQTEPKGKNEVKGAQSQPKGVQKEKPNRPATIGQTQSEPKGKNELKRAQNQPKAAHKEQLNRPATTAQTQSEPKGKKELKRAQNQPKAAQKEQLNKPATTGQAPSQNQQQGQREVGGGTSVTLTTDQRTRIRETVLRGSSAPRVSNVNFSINVGTVIPRTVRIVGVPRTLIEIHPEWRGFKYFVYNDEIIIVDARTFRIVAVIDI